MTDADAALAAFPITRKWPAQHPGPHPALLAAHSERRQGRIMLEETRPALRAAPGQLRHQRPVVSPSSCSLNPNNKIPAIIDPNGPDGQPLGLFESGAILLYLAEKTGRSCCPPRRGRYETMQWLMLQMGGVGPMFGQVGFFHKFAGKDYEDKRPRDRYVGEARRLLGVLDERLEGRAWVMGELYTIVDMAIFPWVRNLIGFYGAASLVRSSSFPMSPGFSRAFVARPAVIRGLDIPKRA